MSFVNDLGMACGPCLQANDLMKRVLVGMRCEDVGEQALMRGLATALPQVRLGAIPVLHRASTRVGHKARVGYSPAAISPPPIHTGCLSSYTAGMVRRAISHMNADNSRAMAVVITVFRKRCVTVTYQRGS